MKRVIRQVKILLFFTAVVMISGCLSDDGNNNQSEQGANNFRFTQEYWGEWIQIDTGETLYLTDTQVLKNNLPYPNKISLRKENKNAIEVTEGKRKYYIIASRIKNASFKGRIVESSHNVIGGSEQGVGSVAVIISNLSNASDNTVVITDSNGNYVVEDIIPWDTYTITVGEKTWTVTPENDDDVGTMAMMDELNIRAYISAKDADRLFSKLVYSLSLNIENIGNTTASEECYAYFTFESSGMYSSDRSDYIKPEQHLSLDGLKPGKKQSYEFLFDSDPITGEFENKRIGVTIVDPKTGIIINNYASVKIKAHASCKIRSQSAVNCVIIAPYKKTYHANSRFVNNSIGYYFSDSMPWCTDDYIIILSSSQNTVCSIGIGVEPSYQWANLENQNIYKPNNSEETATPIGLYEQKMFFLNAGEISYFRMNMGNARP